MIETIRDKFIRLRMDSLPQWLRAMMPRTDDLKELSIAEIRLRNVHQAHLNKVKSDQRNRPRGASLLKI